MFNSTIVIDLKLSIISKSFNYNIILMIGTTKYDNRNVMLQTIIVNVI